MPPRGVRWTTFYKNGKIDKMMEGISFLMKVVQINSTCGIGSTGKICVSVSELLSENDVENYIFYALGKSASSFGKKYASDIEIKIQALKSRIFVNYGFQSKLITEHLIKELDKKLLEEVKEYLESGEIEELADIEEVILAILNSKGQPKEKLEEIRKNKVLKRGAFNKKLFLEREE